MVPSGSFGWDFPSRDVLPCPTVDLEAPRQEKPGSWWSRGVVGARCAARLWVGAFQPDWKLLQQSLMASPVHGDSPFPATTEGMALMEPGCRPQALARPCVSPTWSCSSPIHLLVPRPVSPQP